MRCFVVYAVIIYLIAVFVNTFLLTLQYFVDNAVFMIYNPEQGGENKVSIGNRLKRLRKELDLTQEAFASRIGSVQNTITGYENDRRNPSAPVISLICREFNVNEEWLRTGEGEMFNPEPSNELDALASKFSLSRAEQVRGRN